MNNNELAVIITLFVVACVLFIALAISAFYIGFCVGDSDNRKVGSAPPKRYRKKHKPPDNEYFNELADLASKIDAFDGKAPVVKKDGGKL